MALRFGRSLSACMFLLALPLAGQSQPALNDESAQGILNLGNSDSYAATGMIFVAKELRPADHPEDSDLKYERLPGDPTFGFTESAYWVRITAQSQMDAAWYLVLAAPRLTDVRFFSRGPSGGFEKIETGSGKVFSNRPYSSRSFVFPLLLEKGKKDTYYIRVASQTSVQLPLRFWKPESFHKFELEEMLIFGIVLGAHLLLILYNLSIAFFIRSRVFLYYAGLVTVATLFYMTTYGYAFQYLWPDSPSFALNVNVIMLGLLAFMGAQFTRQAIVSPAWRKTDRMLNVASLLAVAPILLLVFSTYGVAIRSSIVVAILIFIPILIATIHGVRQGKRVAWYFTAAFACYGIGASTFAFLAFGLVQNTPITLYGFIIGATFAVTILSLALASQVRTFKIEKETAVAANRFKSQFLSVMSHEIRTPLTAMVGMAQILTDDLPASDRATYLRVLRNSGDRLAKLVNQVLDFSQIEDGQIKLVDEPFEFGELLDSIAHLFRPAAHAKGLALDLKNEIGTARFRGDAPRLSQVLMILIANAVKFTENGSVLVRAEADVENDQSGRSRIRFSVEDTGIGVSAEQRDAIFSGFFQADSSFRRRHGGSGLGLAIASGILGLMEGQISIRDNAPRGTIFSFVITLNRSDETPSPIAPETEKQHRLKILLVEDDEINRLLATRILNGAGHDTVTAENGLVALEALQRESFDLALVDLQMPVMDGYTAVRRARELGISNSRIPMYAISANTLASDIAECRNSGFNGFIGKPYRKEYLLQIVRLVGEGQPTPADL